MNIEKRFERGIENNSIRLLGESFMKSTEEMIGTNHPDNRSPLNYPVDSLEKKKDSLSSPICQAMADLIIGRFYSG
jgi:hypothetical protein